MQSILGTTTSADGTTVGWESVGNGPAIVVVHGGLRMGKHYRVFAEALADRFAVHLMDRRGRGRSGPAKSEDGLDADVADLQAVLRATGAGLIFGHSAGARVSLETARRTPLRKLALFEPPLAQFIPTEWLPEFELALSRGDSARAMVVFIKGLQMGPQWLPTGLVAFALRMLLRGAAGRETVALLHTLPRDIQVVRALQDESSLKEVRLPVLLLGGEKTPQFLTKSLKTMASLLPDVRQVIVPGVGHNGPDEDNPKAVAAHVGAFFAAA